MSTGEVMGSDLTLEIPLQGHVAAGIIQVRIKEGHLSLF